MAKNLLILFWRIFTRHKFFSLINIAGLSLGIVCTLFIYLYVQDELSYDRMHERYDRIAVVGTSISRENEENHYALCSRTAGEYIRDKYPEIEAQTLVQKWKPVLRIDDQYFNQDQMIFVEPDFFRIFSFNTLEGDPAKAFSDPFQIALTEKMRDKYFPGQQATGQVLVFNDSLQLQVAGVIETPPHNASLTFDALVSYETLRKINPGFTDWTYLTGHLYVLCSSEAAFGSLADKLKPLPMEQFADALAGSGMHVELDLERLSDQRLYSRKTHTFSPTGDITYVTTFATIALFILLLAVINYINLSTARATERAREVGIRKVCGSSRSSLVSQFLAESVLLAFCALALSLVVTALLLPGFNTLTEKAFGRSDLLDPGFLLAAAGITLLTGVAAGFYPAFVLSGFEPITVLRGSFKRSARGQWIRRILVGFQFVVSIALIFCSLAAYRQISYMIHRDAGFDKEQVVVLEAAQVSRQKLNSRLEAFRNDARQYPFLQEIAASNSIPGRGTAYMTTYPEGIGAGETRAMWVVAADYDFPEVYGLELVAGRFFSREFPSDETAGFLINEAAIREIGWKDGPEKAIGKQIIFGNKEARIVGVFRDFHYFSMKDKLGPLLLHIHPPAYSFVSVRMDPAATGQVPATLQDLWTRHFPEYAFSYFFLDEDFTRQYESDQRLLNILSLFTGIGILIAAFGLIGLTTYSATQRMKEIGIRKVLGASIPSLIVLLGRELTAIVLAAFLIGSTLGYILVNRWMEAFPYRTTISLPEFLATGIGSLLLAWVFTGFVIYRASARSPVHVLKTE